MRIKKNKCTNNDLKLDGNKVLWFNGIKWLVKETLKDKKSSEKKFEELKLKKSKI